MALRKIKVVNREENLTSTDAGKETLDSTLSKGMNEAVNNLKTLEDGWVKPNKKISFGESHDEKEDVLISDIMPDKTNSRTKYIKRSNPLDNVFPEGHCKYNENKQTIESILELSKNIKSIGLMQPIIVYRHKGRYMIISGHRRFYSMLLAYGDSCTMMCLIYNQRPKNLYAVRCSENNQQKDLSFSSKMEDFTNASEEANKNYSYKELKNTWHEIVGMKRSTYFLYQRISSSKIVVEAVKDSIITEVNDANTLVKEVKDEEQLIKIIEKIKTSAKNVDVKAIIESQKKSEKICSDKPARGREKRTLIIPKVKGKKQGILIAKKIIFEGLKDMDWSNVDWDDLGSIEDEMSKNFDKLAKIKD